MKNPFKEILSSEEEIRDLLGYPSELVKKKTIHYIDIHCRNFISMSPLLFLSTSDDQGYCDVSPRGDAPGSVLVLDDKHLVVPERPGNRRIDSLRNILLNSRVGMIFIIPGLEETLRINGKAFVIKDEKILEQMEAKDKKPLLGIGVEVEESSFIVLKLLSVLGFGIANHGWILILCPPSHQYYRIMLSHLNIPKK